MLKKFGAVCLAAVLLLTGFLVVWGMYQMTIQISSLLMKNQELAMQVSLLNQENERIIKSWNV